MVAMLFRLMRSFSIIYGWMANYKIFSQISDVIFYDICAILLVVDKVLVLFLCLLITVFSQITINNVTNSYSYEFLYA